MLVKRALEEEGLQISVKDAVELTGCNRATCREYLQILHKAKQTHIVRFVQTNQRGRWFAVFQWGKGVDAPKPGAEERNARRKLKRRVDTHGINIEMLLGGFK